ncbi:hypothetical protein AMTRI_Chr08g208910 [Amborella trichopoda]|uniref:Uncharacterized protein n=1 Tax=Amborella trichopoda TaxID=13333 RepID=W1PCA8_AMBTC|nr:uncharacterized protein LOC18433510 [Amborella trichopoda]ERN05334.1 hypothetical protein AMTR_s00007p00182110 [Amborella trichopoda]|eukprot:XP_006843659.1 uncharacterized protein LOC18433510 [Amborella trichopoda]
MALPSPPISFPFPVSLNPPSANRLAISPAITATKAQQSEESSGPDETLNPTDSESGDFDTRLSQVRLRYRSGTGKKAEVRKAKKGKQTSKKAGVFLPPVPLKEAVSGGLKVDFGFTSYSERLNGWLACLGLVALVLVELGSGQGLLKYHPGPVIFLQVYTVAAASALFVKFEKEKIGVWPEKKDVNA